VYSALQDLMQLLLLLHVTNKLIEATLAGETTFP
jgi:hypothetical protein